MNNILHVNEIQNTVMVNGVEVPLQMDIKGVNVAGYHSPDYEELEPDNHIYVVNDAEYIKIVNYMLSYINLKSTNEESNQET